MSVPSAPVAQGDVLAGKYRVDKVLGIGGMGVVVAARHLQLDQKVALKFLLPEAIGPDTTERFVREGRAAAKIQSEHVARVLDVGTLETGAPYMVMEYLDGKDLAGVVEERGRLPLDEAVGYMLQACEALAEAHAAGIVHRDIKPSNLFLATRTNGAPTIKVLDFGISKISARADATRQEAALTRTTAIMGSPLYMSPEQMTSSKTVDARADIWSLAVTLYEVLTAVPPFGGDTMPELIAAILQAPLPSITSKRADLPPAIEAILSRALEKNRDARYPNIAAFAAAIAPFGPKYAALSLERISQVLRVRIDPPPVSHAVALGATVADTEGISAARLNVLPSDATRTGEKAWAGTQGDATPVARRSGASIVAIAVAGTLGLGILGYVVANRVSAAPTSTQATSSPSVLVDTSASAPLPLLAAPPASSAGASVAATPAVDAGITPPRAPRSSHASTDSPLSHAVRPAPVASAVVPATPPPGPAPPAADDPPHRVAPMGMK